MRARWVLATLATGCFAPHAPAGAPCDPEAASCPTGQTCERDGGAYACRAPDGIDASGADAMPDGPSDTDGDGVTDLIDRCPTIADPMQDNEDGDRFGDACDPCPPFANDDPVDPDQDGVSDVCDPNPTTPGDAILRFEGFHAGIAGWRMFGTWTAAADGVSVEVGNGQHAALLIPAPAAVHRSVMAGVRVTALNGTFAYSGLGVVDQHELGTDDALACQLFRDPPGQQRLGLVDTGPEIALTSAAFALTVGEDYVFAISRDASEYRCRGLHLGTPPTDTTVSDSHRATPTTPEVGIRVHGAGASFQWVLVVTSP